MSSGRFAIIPARAIEDKDLPPPALVLLSCLGTYGDTDGYCIVRRSKIALRLGVTKAAVSKYLRILETLGYLEVSRRQRADGGNSANEYRILFDAVLPSERRRGEGEPDENEEEGVVTAGGYQGVTQEVTRVVTHQVTTKNALFKNEPKKNGLEADFAEFWKAYPRKVKRPHALKAYLGARKKAEAAAILEGLERYKLTKPDWQDWAHPTSWLNAERWGDEPDAPNSQCPPSSNHERDQWALRLADFRQRNFWSSMWGPEPGKAGCRVPRDLLDEMAA